MTVTVVRGDYWEGLYVNGKLVWQHHDLTLDTFFEYVNSQEPFTYESVGLDDNQLKYLEDVGGLPNNLVDLDWCWKPGRA